jgi:hypothetical protein
MTGTAIDIGDARQRRSPDSRSALAYLLASGAAPIVLIQDETGCCTIRVGRPVISRDVPSGRIWWISATAAKPIVRLARKLAGPAPNLTSAATALHEAASDLGATLTPHATAIERAGNAATKLNAYFESMRRSGQLAQFNKQYKQRRTEATANGRGFMSWSTAMTRLKRALVPLLMNGGKQPTVGATVFEEVFPTVT